MRLRLDPADEYTHELGPEPTFNESMYFNVFDPVSGLGGFFRLGNRANEGTAEMTVCLYLPDGRVGFWFNRPTIADNDSFDAAGLRFGVVEPFEELTVAYDGPVLLLDDPMVLTDPKAAFTQSPRTTCTADLRFTRVSPMFGGEPEESHEKPGEEFARGHYEQLVRATGSIQVGDLDIAVDGFGLRDHSWGPRTWQAPFYYRWLTGNVGDEAGFMASRVARRGSDGTRGGFFYDGTDLHLCDHVALTTEWADDGVHQQVVTAVLRSSRPADGGEPRTWTIRGEVQRMVPLRNRREGQVTRIAEGLTRWTLDDGRVGYGWSEYLDQLIDGVPVGAAE